LSIFSSFSLCLPFSFFRVVVQKKTEAKKKKEATHRPTSLSATPPYAKLSPSCFAIRSLTYIYIYIYISTASSSLSSKLYHFNNCFLIIRFFFLRIFLHYLHLQLLVCRQYPPNISYLIIYKIQRKVNKYYYLVILLYK